MAHKQMNWQPGQPPQVIDTNAVIDAKRGVQHLFIYSGHPNGPAGVFRITRTLDTPKLSAALGKKQP